jgi:hypothetical protein
MTSLNKKINNTLSDKQEVVSITYEEIGLFPRSFSRVLDRFLKQVFSDVENLVIQEYRFYRYLFLTTLKCLLILVFVPLFVNFVAKTYIVRPLTEYFWNTKQTEIFLNSYQQKHAFTELKDFEEKIYFESLIYPKSASLFMPSLIAPSQISEADSDLNKKQSLSESESLQKTETALNEKSQITPFFASLPITLPFRDVKEAQPALPLPKAEREGFKALGEKIELSQKASLLARSAEEETAEKQNANLLKKERENTNTSLRSSLFLRKSDETIAQIVSPFSALPRKGSTIEGQGELRSNQGLAPQDFGGVPPTIDSSFTFASPISLPLREVKEGQKESQIEQSATALMLNRNLSKGSVEEGKEVESFPLNSEEKAESFLNSYTLKSSLFVYQTQEADKNIQQRYQEKTIELAQRYNDQSIEAITNFFADLISLISLFYLLYALEIQINITKSFLLEVFFGLDDSKKSLLILLITDLLVGYHSSNLWELFFEFLFHHYGLPESQTGIFLLVATLPVLLDVLFKYLIFRHLNRSSPATVATYHAMIE